MAYLKLFSIIPYFELPVIFDLGKLVFPRFPYKNPPFYRLFLILFSAVDVRVAVNSSNRSFPENEKSPEIF